MKSFIAASVLLSFTISIATVERPSELARLSEPFEVHRKPLKSLFYDLGFINGLRQCGGSGKLLYWRDEACALFPHGLCQRPVDQYFRGELAFIPSQSTNSLGIRVTVTDAPTGNDVSAWENPNLINSTVEAGKVYVVTASTAASKEAQGKLLTTKIYIFRDIDKEVEACAEANIYFY